MGGEGGEGGEGVYCLYSFPRQQVGKIIGQKWRELAEEDKQPYLDAYESEKVVYLEQVKVYKNSTAYKRWLEAKQQGDHMTCT